MSRNPKDSSEEKQPRNHQQDLVVSSSPYVSEEWRPYKKQRNYNRTDSLSLPHIDDAAVRGVRRSPLPEMRRINPSRSVEHGAQVPYGAEHNTPSVRPPSHQLSGSHAALPRILPTTHPSQGGWRDGAGACDAPPTSSGESQARYMTSRGPETSGPTSSYANAVGQSYPRENNEGIVRPVLNPDADTRLASEPPSQRQEPWSERPPPREPLVVRQQGAENDMSRAGRPWNHRGESDTEPPIRHARERADTFERPGNDHLQPLAGGAVDRHAFGPPVLMAVYLKPYAFTPAGDPLHIAVPAMPCVHQPPFNPYRPDRGQRGRISHHGPLENVPAVHAQEPRPFEAPSNLRGPQPPETPPQRDGEIDSGERDSRFNQPSHTLFPAYSRTNTRQRELSRDQGLWPPEHKDADAVEVHHGERQAQPNSNPVQGRDKNYPRQDSQPSRGNTPWSSNEKATSRLRHEPQIFQDSEPQVGSPMDRWAQRRSTSQHVGYRTPAQEVAHPPMEEQLNRTSGRTPERSKERVGRPGLPHENPAPALTQTTSREGLSFYTDEAHREPYSGTEPHEHQSSTAITESGKSTRVHATTLIDNKNQSFPDDVPNPESFPASSRPTVAAIRKRRRLQWTEDLHAKFIEAIEEVGVEAAVPKTILDRMGVDSLSRDNVASHLQKYRAMLKRQGLESKNTDETEQKPFVVQMEASDIVAERGSRQDTQKVDVTDKTMAGPTS